MGLLEKIVGKEIMEGTKREVKLQEKQAREGKVEQKRKTNKFKKNKLSIVAVLFLISIGIGLFYWYEWRPAQIRKECSKKCDFITSVVYPRARVDCYEDCLHEKGIDK